MRTRTLLPLLAVGFGLGVLAAAPAAPADKIEKPDAGRITKLIAQLGSDDFDDREKASAELDAIGEPALDALRQAAKSTDEEVRKRAETLTAGIQKRVESRNALAPKRVHLVYKGTPVKEAVEDFTKKSGYNITLHDPENKLKDRTVTLDTGNATFWQAFDQFCIKASLREADAQDLLNPNPPVGAGACYHRSRPGDPARRADPAEGPTARPADQGRRRARGRIDRARRRRAGRAAAESASRRGPPPAVGAPAIGIAIAPGGAVVIGGPAVGVPQQAGVPEEIILVDGKAEALPTDASSAVRVQALPKADQFGPAPDGEILVGLRLSLEPKMQWQSVDKVTIRKATDDQKQDLVQTTTDAAPANPVGGPAAVPPVAAILPGGGVIVRPLPFPGAILGVPNALGGTRQEVAVHLKKGDKAAKSLTELTGVVTATLLRETTPVITATEILKAGGKSFKGGENGEIKVTDVTKDDNGQITVRVELQPPTDYLPVGNGAVGPIRRRPIRRMPVPIPAAPAPAIPAPGAAPAAVGAAIVLGPVFVGRGMNGAEGLSLVDDKGTPINQVSFGIQRQVAAAGVVSTQYVLTYQAEKGQEASKLIYSGRKVLNVEIPFTLKDVPLP